MNKSSVARLPQGPIHYREQGSGEPIVFVHGLLVNSRLWDATAERLAGDHRCIVPDWPMGSHTDAMDPDADLTPPGLARTIVDFLDELGLERATIVGNDTGGAVSQVLAANHTERVERLVLTNCDTFETFPPFPFNALPPLVRIPGGVSALQLPFRLAPLRRATYSVFVAQPLDPKLPDEWLAPGFRDPEVRRDLRKVTAGANKRHTLAAAERLRSFERPIRFAWGTDDQFFKLSHAQRLAAIVPDSRIVEIPEAKTFSPLDQPVRIAEAIAGFVREQETAAAAA